MKLFLEAWICGLSENHWNNQLHIAEHGIIEQVCYLRFDVGLYLHFITMSYVNLPLYDPHSDWCVTQKHSLDVW